MRSRPPHAHSCPCLLAEGSCADLVQRRGVEGEPREGRAVISIWAARRERKNTVDDVNARA